MKRLTLLVFLLTSAARAAEPLPKPRLILAIVIDQFRYDYTTRFRHEYSGGLERLLAQGAVFTNARYRHFPTVTAVGHSTFLTGATPSVSGIIGNEWFDRKSGKPVTSVSDDAVSIIGGAAGPGSSPRRLLVSTVGDQLKMASAGKARVFGISLKDRSAILTAGHSADAAYWFDNTTGHFVTSTYYLKALPRWAAQFNDGAAARFRGAEWLGHRLPTDHTFFSALESTPFANELLESFVERAIEAEKLGQGPATDLLAISFSANDYVGHEYGPDSPEVHDISLRTDAVLERLFRRVDALIGLQNVLVVLTADHGVAPTPKADAERRMPGGLVPMESLVDAVQNMLKEKYGEGNWVAGTGDQSIYLDLALIREKKLDRVEVTKTAREAVMAVPHVFRVYTYGQLLSGKVLPDYVSTDAENGFNVRRGADLNIVLDPYWMFSGYPASHGSPFGYDTHVPVIFMGPGIRAGTYDESIAVNDIAPTLATMLGLETPSGSAGRVLTEILAHSSKQPSAISHQP